VAGALSAAELGGRQGRELLQAIRLGYEIYGRILDMFDPATTPWDHVSASGLASAAMTGWLLGLAPERLANALALAATHSGALREIRGGHVSAAKSIANGVEVQSATLLTLLAAKGITGPGRAIEGRYGFANVILDGVNFDQFFSRDGEEDRILLVGLKMYPCFAMAQGPIAAAIELRSQLEGPADSLEKIVVSIADSAPARTRLGDAASKVPTSHEEADHSIHYLVAAALVDGRVDLDQFENARWRDPDITGLISRIEARIDPGLPALPVSAFPCRIEAHTKTGEHHTLDCQAAPGHPSNPVAWDKVKEKFESCAEPVLGPDARRDVIAMVEDIDGLDSVGRLLAGLVPR
jgi:2-methylcitrate dehydratase